MDVVETESDGIGKMILGMHLFLLDYVFVDLDFVSMTHAQNFYLYAQHSFTHSQHFYTQFRFDDFVL